MKKTIRTILALVLAMIMLVPVFASCGEKAAPKVTVGVYIYKLDEKKADDPWLINKELKIEEGKTAFDAVAALCEARGAKYTTDINGMFDSFENDEGKVTVPAQETLADGKVRRYRFGWKLADTVMSGLDNPTQMKDYVLKDGDVIKVFIQFDEVDVANP